jgi:hypothetical protein
LVVVSECFILLYVFFDTHRNKNTSRLQQIANTT